MNTNQHKLGLAVSTLVLAALASGGVLASQGSSAAPAASGTKSATETHHTASEHHSHHMSARVQAVQQALNQHGASLKTDGHEGPATRTALKKFQADNGLKATGHMDKTTLEKLGVK